jgi:hypothetical protein
MEQPRKHRGLERAEKARVIAFPRKPVRTLAPITSAETYDADCRKSDVADGSAKNRKTSIMRRHPVATFIIGYLSLIICSTVMVVASL